MLVLISFKFFILFLYRSKTIHNITRTDASVKLKSDRRVVKQFSINIFWEEGLKPKVAQLE